MIINLSIKVIGFLIYCSYEYVYKFSYTGCIMHLSAVFSLINLLEQS